MSTDPEFQAKIDAKVKIKAAIHAKVLAAYPPPQLTASRVARSIRRFPHNRNPYRDRHEAEIERWQAKYGSAVRAHIFALMAAAKNSNDPRDWLVVLDGVSVPKVKL